MTSYNEFQRELRNRGIDGHSAYVFTLIYERMIHLSKQIDDNAKATLALANSLQGLVGLHESTQKKLTALATQDYMVESVPNEPEGH